MAPYQPRERKHKKIARQKLKQEEPVVSKKEKRLNKYLDTKLRKDENLELLKKLAGQKVDTGLLQSSRQLGRVRETKRERFGRALKEKRAGLDVEGGEDVLYQRRKLRNEAEEGSEEDEDLEEEHFALGVSAVDTPAQNRATFGGGLKRPLDLGEDGRPIMTKRKRRKVVKVVAEPLTAEDDDDDDDDSMSEQSSGASAGEEWNGFGSEEDASSSSETSEPQKNGEASEDEESEAETEASEQSNVSDKKERVSAFKQWATSQRNVALDFQPSALPENNAAILANFKPRQQSPDLAVPVLQMNGQRTSKPAAAITITRPEAVQAARLELPVVQEEQKIMEAIHNNPTVIICGATGSGKTTQVPQMMFESGYGSHIGELPKDAQSKYSLGPEHGMIGVTQPRRVAATSVADRVAHELGAGYKYRVAHQVRYDSSVKRETAIKFMTDGILLREIGQDFLLSKYSAIVLDEAHERSVNTDILIGMLSRIVDLRTDLAKEEENAPAAREGRKHYPLKLVIMSATLRVADFADNRRLFRHGAPPVVEAEGRQHPVTVHFSRRTQRDYVAETVMKVSRGHRKLPPGGMLVFLPGQNEIRDVAKGLRERLGGAAGAGDALYDDLDEANGSGRGGNDYLEGEESDGDDSDVEITGLDDDDKEFHIEEDAESRSDRRTPGTLNPHILPLYAALPTSEQRKVFLPAPSENHRVIILATNVAETSLTIPGVRYVFDCGRSKEKRYDLSTGVQTFEIDWISKASAAQRAGRAGRTGPGHCWRLFSSAVYEQFFPEFAVPEILRTPLESTVLQLKAMDIEDVVNFPFPTPPEMAQLARAERLLRTLGAIGTNGKITAVGREILGFPVNPRFGKMLLLARRNGIVAHTVAVVAALGVGELFIPEMQGEQGRDFREDGASDDEDDDKESRTARRLEDRIAVTAGQNRHQAYTRAHAALARWDDQSDVVKLLTTAAAYAEASTSPAGRPSIPASRQFCEEFFLREKGMQEVQLLRQQLHSIVSAQATTQDITSKGYSPLLPLPTQKERAMLNQVVVAGYLDQIAIRSDLLPTPPQGGRKPRRAIEVPYTTLTPSISETDLDFSADPTEQALQKSVFVHPSSVLARLAVHEMPGYIIFSHLSRAQSSTINPVRGKRTRMHVLTSIGAKALAALAEGTPLLRFGNRPVGKAVELLGGKRECWVEVSLRSVGGEGGEWGLTAWKVLQRRVRGVWEVERVLAR
ncbi:hypothetical protein LTR62_000927 [Meristemomyces frigidus]|uniref:RNA helicase n=1 Tax=Meristemomyces frigidus TaxID=1508187 RepID=A0AAN7YGM0_9PEZI|nr:hypothetical protein LTR62_000927 [Meristemomyces frigidus]